MKTKQEKGTRQRKVYPPVTLYTEDDESFEVITDQKRLAELAKLPPNAAVYLRRTYLMS